jgi:hypothetical protein
MLALPVNKEFKDLLALKVIRAKQGQPESKAPQAQQGRKVFRDRPE